MTASPARNGLIKAIHAAQRAAGLDDDTYRDLVEAATGKRSSKDLTDPQLRLVLGRLNQGRPAPRPTRADTPHARKARALWLSLHHLGLVDDPAETALRAWVKRQHQVDDLRFVRAAEAAPVIEGLKAWAERAGVEWDAYDKMGVPQYRGRRAVLAAQWRILVKAGAAPALDLGRHAMAVVGQPSPAFCDPSQLDRLIADLGGRVRALKQSE